MVLQFSLYSFFSSLRADFTFAEEEDSSAKVKSSRRLLLQSIIETRCMAYHLTSFLIDLFAS